MQTTDHRLKELMRAALDGALKASNRAAAPEFPWVLIQADHDQGSREDCSIYYNPVILVRKRPGDTEEFINAAATAAVRRIVAWDPNGRLGPEEYREVLVAALRTEGYQVVIEDTSVIDFDD